MQHAEVYCIISRYFIHTRDIATNLRARAIKSLSVDFSLTRDNALVRLGREEEERACGRKGEEEKEKSRLSAVCVKSTVAAK